MISFGPPYSISGPYPGSFYRREVSQRDLQWLVDNWEWSLVQYLDALTPWRVDFFLMIHIFR